MVKIFRAASVVTLVCLATNSVAVAQTATVQPVGEYSSGDYLTPALPVGYLEPAADSVCPSLCDEEACDDCAGWYFSANAVFLKRSRPDLGTTVAANPAGTPFSTTQDFEFDYDLGADLTLRRYMPDGDAWEVRFLQVTSTADFTFNTPGNFIGGGFTGPTGTNFVERYVTELYNSEFNLRRDWTDRLTVLAGFRYIQLSDEASYKLNGNVASGRYDYNNHLYGGQLGFDLALTDVENPLQVNLVGKAGYYANAADGGIFEFQGNNFIGEFKASNKRTAFSGEINLTAGYRLTNNLTLRGGYQFLWLEGLALGSDAASLSLLNPSLLRQLPPKNDLIYQGGTFGVEYIW